MLDLRTPKGTLDFNPIQTSTRDEIIEHVTKIFKRQNAVPISTPTFELRSILMNKYGEDSKLIYNLEDQGGDICSLRYDLTVPFSRYLGMNRISKIKRYQIGNVFRRDNPSFKTGRLREFIQADFDICGENLPMVNDAEVLKVIYDVLEEFKPIVSPNDDYDIRLNDRRVLSGMLFLCGVEESKQGNICSTIDKSDKLGWADLEKEFIEKGLRSEQISYIKKYIEFKGENKEILEFLKNEIMQYKLSKSKIEDNSKADDYSLKLLEQFETALDEINLLLEYIKVYEVKNVRFDLSLARGLEYYTGIVFEATYKNQEIGSVIGGGRYDNLCKSISSFSVPCVGFSVGISRLFSIYPLQQINSGIFVGSAYGLLIKERMEVLNELWKNGFRAETFTGKRVNFKDQIDYAKKNNFDLAIFIGENEVKEGKCTIIIMKTESKIEIERNNLIEYLDNKY